MAKHRFVVGEGVLGGVKTPPFRGRHLLREEPKLEQKL
jgi:hypothetical protein